MGLFTEICDLCPSRVEWVLASERLPERHQPVLVSGGLVYMDGEGNWRTYMERSSTGKCLLLNWSPKYWAYLPQPPK